MAKNLLLVSNSILHGSGYLDHCEQQIRDVLEGREHVVFIPYARPSGRTLDEYTDIARERFQKMGFNLSGVHIHSHPRDAVENAEAVFVGGGNTFVLLKALYDANLLDVIRGRVREGMPYIGTSAGSNIAGKTIMTTNDMPIAYPPSFDAMGIVPFIINPHYLDPDPNSKHMGETRETRIKEYHAYSDDVVVGLREGAMLHVVGDSIQLKGSTGARIFRKGQEPTEHQPGESLDFLLSSSA